MTHNFADFGLSSGLYTGPVASDDAPGNGIARVILVAIRNDLLPPTFFGQDPLQRMRATIVGPRETAMFHPSEVAFAPRPPALPTPANRPLSPRLVQGDILRDQAGRLYEKIGTNIRPLHRLVPGPHGEIFDLAPSVQRSSQVKTAATEQPGLDAEEMRYEKKAAAGTNGEAFKESDAFPRPVAERLSPITFRKLFPDAGLQRLVPWGDFKPMLVFQLAHPERLHEAYRLPCCVQIYEVIAPVCLDSIAAIVVDSVEKANQFHLLTADLAGKLQLEALLQRRPRVPIEIRREPGMLLPYDLVFRLQPAQDPTRDNVMQDHAQQRAPTTAPLPFTPAAAESSNGTSPHAAMAQPEPAGFQKLSPKNEIPQQFVQPHEFRLSREEVLYDLRLASSSQGSLSSFFRWLKNLFAGGAELRKWQALLQGKNLDEQLWTVRPPQDMLSHPAIREWAYKTLVMAGYDPQTMLMEWEIFWRRKGL